VRHTPVCLYWPTIGQWLIRPLTIRGWDQGAGWRLWMPGSSPSLSKDTKDER
jgi:hypothetical protein